MEIKTKFNVGDEVFYLKDNIVQCKPIDSITIRVYPNDEIVIVYDFIVCKQEFRNVYEGKNEKQVFATKQELLESL